MPSLFGRGRVRARALLQHLKRPLERHPAVATALAVHRESAAGVRTRELARAVGLSERRFIDVFRHEVGMTPKLFDRVQRFQRALGQLAAAASVDWALLAAECGYFDQSHLIRDFREFTGVVPTDYLRRAQTLRALGAHSKPNHLAFAH